MPVIVRGDGCYLEDANGKRYLDALAGLFSVNIGYGFGDEIGEAAAAQMRELPFYTNWSYAHPRAIELAQEVASLAPGDLNRVLLRLGRLGGGRVGVEARAPVLPRARREADRGRGRDAARRAGRLADASQVQGDRAAGRLPRHDLRRALDQRHPRAADPVRAARARGSAREEHEPLPPAAGGDRGGVHRDAARGPRADDPGDGAGDRVPRAHGAGAERRRGVHAAGGLLARRPRALRPLRHPALGRRGDHGLRPRRRLVRLGALRHPAGPHLLGEGALVVLRRDRRGHRDRPGDGAVPRGDVDVLARDHLRRAPDDVRDRAEEHRDHEARADRRGRARARGRLPRDAGAAARAADRRRPARDGLLLRARARQGQGDARRRSPTRSARRSSAASSRRRCSSAG